MCLFYLSVYGCGQIIQLNDFVWFSLFLHRQRCFPPFRRRWPPLLPYWRATQGGSRNFFLHFDSVITINRRNLAPPTLPDVLVTGR